VPATETARTRGAVTGVLMGVVSSVGLIIISPGVWPGPDSEGGAIGSWDLANPGIVSIPLGFLGCWLGTMLSKERDTERSFDELYVRSETGLGAEQAIDAPRPAKREREAVSA
jgi:cation/acetate symporter